MIFFNWFYTVVWAFVMTLNSANDQCAHKYSDTTVYCCKKVIIFSGVVRTKLWWKSDIVINIQYIYR